MDSNEVVAAAIEVADVFDTYTLNDLGPTLTCGEVESLANLLRSVGADENAYALIEAHAESDDEGDDHHAG